MDESAVAPRGGQRFEGAGRYPLSRHALNFVDDFARQCSHVDLSARDRAAPEAGKFEQVVYHRTHLPDIVRNLLELVSTLVVQLVALVFLQNPRKAVDRPQRRAQVVGDRIAVALELLVGGFELCGVPHQVRVELLDGLFGPLVFFALPAHDFQGSSQFHEYRHLGAQDLRVDGLEHVVHGARGIASEGFAFVARSEENDRGALVAPALPDQRRGLEPVQARHPDVEQNERELVRERTLQSFAPRSRLGQILPERLEYRFESEQSLGLVVHQKNVDRLLHDLSFLKLPPPVERVAVKLPRVILARVGLDGYFIGSGLNSSMKFQSAMSPTLVTVWMIGSRKFTMLGGSCGASLPSMIWRSRGPWLTRISTR